MGTPYDPNSTDPFGRYRHGSVASSAGYRDRYGSVASSAGYRDRYGSVATAPLEQTSTNQSLSHYSSGLAYPERVFTNPASYDGYVKGAHFCEPVDGSQMGALAEYVGSLPQSFQDVLQRAGSISVRFGHTQGGGVGEWNADMGTVVLNPYHSEVHEKGFSRLSGAASFEIINASTESQRKAIEERALSGQTAQQATAYGVTPQAQFGREMEYLEWQNVQTHRQILNEYGREGTTADLFHGQNFSDFESYYNQQVASGHTHSYEFRYQLITSRAQSANPINPVGNYYYPSGSVPVSGSSTRPPNSYGQSQGPGQGRGPG